MSNNFAHVLNEIKSKYSLKGIAKFIDLLEDRYYRRPTNLFCLEKKEESIINYYLMKPSYKIGTSDKYTRILYDLFESIPDTMFDSKIFNRENIEYIYNEEQAKRIESFRNKVRSEYLNILDNLEDGNRIDDYYLRYAISTIGSDDIVARKTYEYLINNIKYNPSYFADEFIVKYTAYLSYIDLRMKKVYAYTSDYNFIKNVYLDCAGNSLSDERIVIIAKEFMNKKKPLDRILNLLVSVAHEGRHIYQVERYNNGEISELSFNVLMNHILNGYSKDEYARNYFNFECELDAEAYANSFAYDILCKYARNTRLTDSALVYKYESLLYSHNNLKYGNNNTEVIDDDIYNVKNLDIIIRKNPNLVLQYSMLRIMYDNNGRRRSFCELLDKERELTKNTKYAKLPEVLKTYYLSEISRGINIDLSKKDKEEREIIILKLLDLAIYELEEINELVRLTKLYKYSDSYRTNKKIRIILKRIKNIMYYLNKNCVLIDELHNNLINTKMDKMIYMLYNLDIRIDSNIFNNIFYAKNTYEVQQSGYKLIMALK